MALPRGRCEVARWEQGRLHPRRQLEIALQRLALAVGQAVETDGCERIGHQSVGLDVSVTPVARAVHPRLEAVEGRVHRDEQTRHGGGAGGLCGVQTPPTIDQRRPDGDPIDPAQLLIHQVLRVHEFTSPP